MSLPDYFIGIDAETFGPNLNMNHTTELGVAVVDRENLKVVFKKSYPIRLEGWLMASCRDINENLRIIEESSPVTRFNQLMHFMQTRTFIKCIDMECEREFWSKHPERYKETMDAINDPHAYIDTEVMHQLQDQIRARIYSKTASFVTDTTAFDGGVFNSLFFPRASHPTDAKSLNLFFLNSKDKLVYRPVEQSDAFARGIAWNVPPSHGDTVFTRACKALGVKDIPKWKVQHDHHPENDAAVIALNHAFLVNRVEEIKKETQSS